MSDLGACGNGRCLWPTSCRDAQECIYAADQNRAPTSTVTPTPTALPRSGVMGPVVTPEDWKVHDLAMLIRQLVHSMNSGKTNKALAARAMEYLKRHDLQGSPLHAAIAAIVEDE